MAIVTLKPAPLVKSGELTREFVEAYSASLNDPEWLAARRLEALRVFRDTPAPQRTNELWRRVDLSAFKLDQVIPAISAGVSVAPGAFDDLVTSLSESNSPGWVLHVDGGHVQHSQIGRAHV